MSVDEIRIFELYIQDSTCTHKTISNDVRQNVIELCFVLFFVTYCQKNICVIFL